MLKRCFMVSLAVFVLVAVLAGCSAAGEGVSSESPPAGFVSQTKNIITGSIVVPAWGSRDLVFEIDGLNMTGARLVGWFHASGGSDNEIEMFVADDTAFETWNQGRAVTPFYNSGKTTLGEIDVKMPSSSTRYHLVFNNIFSGSMKTIEAQIDLEYYARPSPTPGS
jgi:hypothetical protein